MKQRFSQIKTWIALFTVVILTLGGAACSLSGKGGTSPKKWVFALEEISGSVQDAYAQEFKRQIEEKSEGRISVRIYPYGTLGNSDQLTELVATGAVQFAMASPGHMGKMIPELQVFSLHYLLSDDSRVNERVFSGESAVSRIFDELYREKGFRLLSFFSEGWQVWTANRPITRPEQFGGFKMRVMPNPLLLEVYRAYGANPVPLPYSDVYSSLQLNMIDGQVNPVFAIEEMSFYEVSDYMIFPQAVPFVASVMTGDRFYRRLSADERGWIQGAVESLRNGIEEIQTEYNASRLRTIQSKKPSLRLIRLNRTQRERFRRLAEPVHEKYVQSGGDRAAEVLQAIRKETK